MVKQLVLRLVVLFFLLGIFVMGGNAFVFAAEQGVDEVGAEVQAAYSELGKGEVDKAIISFNKAIALGGNNTVAYTGLGNAYLQKGETDKALNAFNTAVTLDAKNSFAHAGLGHVYIQKGETDKAIASFNSAITLDAKNMHAYFGLGIAYLAAGKKDLALEQYNILKDLNADLAKQLNDQIQLK